MSKEIINPKSIRANNPDWQEGYDQGLLAGFTKSIVLIRHLQRTLVENKSEFDSQQQILSEAMELIANKIEPNNNE